MDTFHIIPESSLPNHDDRRTSRRAIIRTGSIVAATVAALAHHLTTSTAATQTPEDTSMNIESPNTLRPVVLTPAESEVFSFPPTENLTWRATAEDTGGVFDAMESIVQPDLPGPPEHIHDVHDELFFILEGAFRFRLDGEEFEAPTNSYAFIPKGVAHTWANTTSEPARMLVHFLPGGMQGFFEAAAEVLAIVPLDPAALTTAIAPYSTRVVGPPMLP